MIIGNGILLIISTAVAIWNVKYIIDLDKVEVESTAKEENQKVERMIDSYNKTLSEINYYAKEEQETTA